MGTGGQRHLLATTSGQAEIGLQRLAQTVRGLACSSPAHTVVRRIEGDGDEERGVSIASSYRTGTALARVAYRGSRPVWRCRPAGSCFASGSGKPSHSGKA